MSENELQREFAFSVVKELRSAGFYALWAGGCVRDQLLGKTPKDYDVATNALPEQVRQLFGHRRTLAIGASFGVISVLGQKDCEPIEVATFRSDGEYVDGRHPREVQFTSAEEDAERRDFTINGLFYDPITEQVIDYVDGQSDLEKNVLRAIGNPLERFAEDKLRMLRAIRFATTLAFEIEQKTFEAIKSMSNEIQVVSAERIGSELSKLLTHPNRKSGLILLRDSGLLEVLLPELESAYIEDDSAWQKTLTALENIHSDSLPVSLATLLLPLSKSSNISNTCRRFRFTNKTSDRTRWLVDNLTTAQHAKSISWPKLQRCLVHPGSKELMELAAAFLGSSHEGVQECAARLLLPIEKLNPPLLVTGDDLIRHGLEPGPHFSKLLEAIRDAQLNGEIASQSQAFQFADQWSSK